MKSFIVTGGYGFIGSNLVRFLLKKKFRVINIDNLSYSAQKYNLKGFKYTECCQKCNWNLKNKVQLKFWKIVKTKQWPFFENLKNVQKSLCIDSNHIKINVLKFFLIEASYSQKFPDGNQIDDLPPDRHNTWKNT